MIPRILFALMILLAATAVATERSWPPESDLPEGVLAMVDGEPLTEQAYYERLIRERGGGELGAGALQQLLDTRLIGAEMKRRGKSVKPSEVDERYDELAKQLEAQTGGTTTMEDALTQSGVSVALFRSKLEFLVGLEKLAREDFGLAPDAPISESKTNLWLAELRENSDIRTTDLPAGVAVAAKDLEITTIDFGRAVADLQEASYLEELLRAMASERLIQRALDARELEVETSDLTEEMDFRRWAFDHFERYPGVPFDQYIEATQGMSSEALMATENFEYQVALKKIVRATVPEAERRAYYDEHKAEYGPLRRIQHLLVSTQTRTEEEAIARFDKIREEIDAGVPFGSVIQQHSDDNDRQRSGETGYFSAEAPYEDEFLAAVFALEPGDISAPIRTTRGFEMVSVIGVKPRPTFEEIDGLIVRDLALEWLEEHRDAADVRPAWLFEPRTADEAAPAGEG